MKINKNKIAKIRKGFDHLIRKTCIENDKIVFSSFYDLFEPISNEILNSNKYQQIISKTNLIIHFYESIRDISKDRINGATNLHFLSVNEIDRCFDKFIAFLEILPLDYEVLFQIEASFPKEFESFNITENISFIRTSTKPSKLSQLFTLAGHDLELNNDNDFNETYIKIKVKGFTDGDIEDSAIRNAVKILKRFLYLSFATNLFAYKKHVSTRNYLKSLCISEDQQEIQIEMYPTISHFLSKINFQKTDTQNLEDFLDDLTKKTKVITNFFNASENVEELQRSLDWAFDGLINYDDENSLIQTCIGLEAILADEDIEKRNSFERLADRCAFILGENREDRKQYYKQFVSFYKTRSALVHGNVSISKDDIQNSKFYAEKYLRKLIFKEIEQLK